MRPVVIIEGYLPTLMPEGPRIEEGILGKGYKVSRFSELAEVPDDLLVEAEGLIIRPGVIFGGETIEKLECCKVIVSLGVGFNHIDVEALKKRQIPVCNVPDFATDEVALVANELPVPFQNFDSTT